MDQVLVGTAAESITTKATATAVIGSRSVPPDQSRRSAVIGLAIGALVLLGLEAAVLAETTVPSYLVSILLPAVGMINVAIGCLAWLRRPTNRTGVLLVYGGATMMIASLINSSLPLVSAVGVIASGLIIPVQMHLLMAFPSGRLQGRFKIIAITMYLAATVLACPEYLFAGTGEAYSILMIENRPRLVAVTVQVHTVVGMALIIGCVLLVLRRMRGLEPRRRRAVRALIAYWAASLLWFPLTANVLVHTFDLSPAGLYVWQLGGLAGIPIMFGWAVLRGGFVRMREVEELSAWLGAVDPGGRPRLTDLLGKSLGDPSVTLWSVDPVTGGYVDDAGNPYDDDADQPDRGTVAVELGTRRVGLVGYDRLLLADPAPVRAAASLVALELDRERLTSELLEHRAALRASRARLVQIADRERRRIAYDLHDGLQPRLVLLGLAVSQAARDAGPDLDPLLERLQTEVDATAGEVRRLVYGVMPPPLIEQGLVAAVADLVDRFAAPVELALPAEPIPLSIEADTAGFFFVSEALTNAVRHAAAMRIAVRIDHQHGQVAIQVSDDGVGGAQPGAGLGLRGSADRADVLGGRLTMHSPPGAGTTVVMEFPCGC